MPFPKNAAVTAAALTLLGSTLTPAPSAEARALHRAAKAHTAGTARALPIAITIPSLAPRGEVRAMWIVRDSLTSPEKIHNAIALASRNHFNAVFVQVRGRGDAFYNSRYEPRSEQLDGQPASFDPLAVAITEGHKAGIEVHAWMNTFFVWHKPRHPYALGHIINQHPEWLVQDRDGNVTITEKHDVEGAFLDPALPEVREYTKNVFLDVVNHYDIDGIHFDYCRFPSERFSFSRRDLTAFREWLLPQITPNDAAYADSRMGGNRLAWYGCFPDHWRTWRQSLVTETVKSISDEAHRIRPGIVVSAAVFPIYRVASQDKGQAWHEWLQTGVLDAACPMTYGKATEAVGAQIRDAVANSGGKPIIAGVGAWQMPARSAIAKGIVYRQLGAAGINFFSYDGMTRDGRSEEYLARVGHALFPTAAPVPLWHKSPARVANDSAQAAGSEAPPTPTVTNRPAAGG